MFYPSAGVYGEMLLFGSSRHLLSRSEHETVGSLPMAPSKSPCLKSPSLQCQTGPSTLIIIVSGMCAMMLLVVIALVLLCCSHFKYRHMEERHRQLSREGNGPIAAPVLDEPRSCDSMVLVLLPGEKHPITCARPCPLSEESARVDFELASSDLTKEKPLGMDTSNTHQQPP